MAARKKSNKIQRREVRLQKARQWLVTYQGTPKHIVKHYKDRFHLDTSCALADLQSIGVAFTQEYLNAVKKNEADRIRIKREKDIEKKQEEYAAMTDDMDGIFSYIAGYTSGGAPYGVTWEEVGIDSELPFDEKVRLYHGSLGWPDLSDI